jgi:hypothetical protein
VTLDEVADVFGQFVAVDIEPGLDFRGDIFGDVLCPVFEGMKATTRSGSLKWPEIRSQMTVSGSARSISVSRRTLPFASTLSTTI